MQTLASFLVAALAAGLASCSPVAPNTKVGSFELKQSINPRFSGRNGPQALANAYRKYGKPVPKHIEAAAARTHTKRSSGSVSATSIQGDLEYLIDVGIGSPAQTLKLDLDTGSSDLWVFSTETGGGGSQTRYDARKSSTAKKMAGATWQIRYGDGSSCSGDVYTDAVAIGGLTVKAQAVESAKQVSQQFAQGAGDGLLGLAFSKINTVRPTPQKTWFDKVQSQLDAPLFVADLRHHATGSYVFGKVPADAASGVHYVDVDSSRGFWGFSASTEEHGPTTGIADTGTTLLIIDDDIVESYYSNVDGAQNNELEGGYVFDCSANLPDFSFSVGGGNITIPGQFINYAQGDGGQCFGGIQPSGQLGINIFGDIALKAAYVVFDAGKNRLGWAQKRSN